MLVDKQEIAIIANAKQKNVRDPNRSRDHFLRIFDDFLIGYDFSDKSWLDLGPGQFDFAELAREKGAAVHNVDNDPAVLELGRFKGFTSIEGNLKHFNQIDFPNVFYDGLFCKFSINAFWMAEDISLVEKYTDDLVAKLKPNFTAWVAPWNGVPKKISLTDVEIAKIVDTQKNSFINHGFDARELSVEQAKYYGVNGVVANNIVFTKGL